jgi:hypothetical protein
VNRTRERRDFNIHCPFPDKKSQKSPKQNVLGRLGLAGLRTIHLESETVGIGTAENNTQVIFMEPITARLALLNKNTA